MSAPHQSYTVTWIDPAVGPHQVALASIAIFYTDLDTHETGVVGTVLPGVQTFTGGVLAAGKRYTFAVQATDVNGNVGPMSAQSNELDTPLVPGMPTNVVAVLN